jgi:tetratricopeptide (TPR) repeat protein
MDHYTAGRFEQAIEDLKQAVRLNSNYAEAYRDLGNAFFALGQYEEATEVYAKSFRLKNDWHFIRREPIWAEAHNKLGIAFSLLNREDEADHIFTQAITHQPESDTPEIIRLSTDSAEPLYYLGTAYRQWAPGLSDSNKLKPLYFKAALELLEKAASIKPEWAKPHFSLGMTYFGLGRYEEAVQSFERANSLKLSNEQCYYYLGVSYHKTGQEEKAIQQYELLKKVNPRAAKTLWDVIHR